MIIGNIPFLHTPPEKSVDDQVLFKDLMEFRMKCMLYAGGRFSKKVFIDSIVPVLYKYRRSRSAMSQFKDLADLILYNLEESKDAREEQFRKEMEQQNNLLKQNAFNINKANIDRAWRRK